MPETFLPERNASKNEHSGDGKITLSSCCTPDSIEARSFAIIDAEAGEPKPFTGHAWSIARRLVHTSGDFSLLQDLVLSETAIQSGLAALKAGAPIFTDTEMVRAGIPVRRLVPLGITATCVLSQPDLAAEAARRGTTRTRAGIEALHGKLGGSIVAIGNAPTALLAVLAYVATGGAKPALVVGMPVGFVNALESKELLLREASIPSLVLRGRRGGSPLAAATVNALLCILLGQRESV